MVIRRPGGLRAGATIVALAQAGCQWIGGINDFALTSEDAASSSSWCASLVPPATLCSDFDEGPSLAPWDTPASGATLAVDTNVYDSPPGSLRVDVPSLAAGQSAFAGLTYTFNSPATKAHVELEYSASTDTDDKIIEIVWPSSYAVAIVLPPSVPIPSIPVQETVPTGGSTSYVTPVATSSPQAAPDPTGSGWVKIALTVQMPEDGGTPSLEADVGDATWTAPLTGFPTGAASSLLIRVGGVFVDDSPSGWVAHFDNVAVTVQ